MFLFSSNDINLIGKTVTTILNAPQWNYRLASNSEAYVKADREPDISIEELVQESVEKIKELDKSDGYATGTMDKVGNNTTSNNKYTSSSSKYQQEKLPTDAINPSWYVY